MSTHDSLRRERILFYKARGFIIGKSLTLQGMI
jgi:hypothetical protein